MKHIHLLPLSKSIALTSAAIATSFVVMPYAHSAGLEYSKQSVLPFFEKGNYAELSYAFVDPNIAATDQKGNKIDDMMDSFTLPGAAIRLSPDEQVAMAVIYEKPWGVDTVYPGGSMFTNKLGTTEARLSTDGITTLFGGKIDNVWLYGGVEYQTISGSVKGAQPVGEFSALSEASQDASASIGGISSIKDYYNVKAKQAAGESSAIEDLVLAEIDKAVYGVQADQDNGIEAQQGLKDAPTLYTLDFEDNDTFVPVIGVAYEIPEIMLRGALTWRAPAEYTIKGQENLILIQPKIAKGDGVTPVPAAEGLPYKGSVDIAFPQSVNFDFQTGLSEKYQLLGMVNARWVNWSDFEVTPPVALKATNEPLVKYDNDGYSVEVALGKQFSDNFAGEVRVGYDNGTGQPVSLLGPYDKVKTIAMGGQYDVTDELSVAGGAQYMWFEGGNVMSENDGKIAVAEDGDGYAVGMKVSYRMGNDQ